MEPISLDRAEKLTKILSMVAIPLFIAIAGFYLNLSMQRAEINVKFLELAIDVLQEEPALNEAGEPLPDPLRDWAVGVLKDQTGSAFDLNAQEALRKKALPPPRNAQAINPEALRAFATERTTIPYIEMPTTDGRPLGMRESDWNTLKAIIGRRDGDRTEDRRPGGP